jgi:hypothetical protein
MKPIMELDFPISVSRETPILRIFVPICRSFLLDRFWYPTGFHVIL